MELAPSPSRLQHTDDQLMEHVAEGDHHALRELVRRHGGRVRSFLAHLVRDESWADDLAQETFVRAFQRAEAYQARGNLMVWLLRIARNLATDLLRREGRLRRRTEELRTRAGQETQGPSASPLGHVLAREFEVAFEAAVEGLPEIYRSVFVLKEYEEMSYEQIGDVLNTSPKTVSSRLHRARRQLQARLTRFLEP